MTPTEMHIEALMEKIEILTKQLDEVTNVKERYEKALICIRDINCEDQVKYMNQEFALFGMHSIAKQALNGSGDEKQET